MEYNCEVVVNNVVMHSRTQYQYSTKMDAIQMKAISEYQVMRLFPR